MGSKATSFRLSEQVHARLREHARQEGVAIRVLLEQLVEEGIEARRHPGIVHRGRPGARRAALAAGPDVWEVMDAMRFVEGSPEERIAAVARSMDLHPRQVRLAVEYAASHADEIDGLVEENDRAAREASAAAEARSRYLGS